MRDVLQKKATICIKTLFESVTERVMDYTVYERECRQAEERIRAYLEEGRGDLARPQGAVRRLFEEVEKKTSSHGYAVGGRHMDRGYYCPSTIRDLVIVGQHRGKLLRCPKAASVPSFRYGFDCDGRLLTVLTFKEQTGEVCRREVLFYEGEMTYGIAVNEDGSDLTLCVCHYGNEGIFSYRLYFYKVGGGVNRFFAEEYRREDEENAQVTFYEFRQQSFPEGKEPSPRLFDHRRYDCTVKDGVLLACYQTDFDSEGTALPPFAVHVFKREGRIIRI